MSEESRSGTLVKPGPRIVRAWFDTVINPVLRALDSELQRVASQNWTWQFRPGDFLGIHPLRSLVEEAARPNLEQLCEIYPRIQTLGTQHDAALSNLLTHVNALYRAIRNCGSFQEQVERALSAESLASIGVKSIVEVVGAYPPDEIPDLIIEHVVNNHGPTPAYYSTSKLWNPYRSEFLAVLDRSEIAPYKEAVLEAGKLLSASATVLLSELRRLRSELSLKYDVPYVSQTSEKLQSA